MVHKSRSTYGPLRAKTIDGRHNFSAHSRRCGHLSVFFTHFGNESYDHVFNCDVAFSGSNSRQQGTATLFGLYISGGVEAVTTTTNIGPRTKTMSRP